MYNKSSKPPVFNDGSGRIIFDPEPWDDLQVNLGQLKLPGVSDPAWVLYRSSRVLSFSKSADNTISFTAQLPHSYKTESDIEFHLHTVYPDSAAGNTRWLFTYSWADIGGSFATAATAGILIASPATADVHRIHNIVSSISGTGKTGVSSFLLCSLTRQGSAVDDSYDNVVYLIGLDFHFQKDTIGSLNETSK